MIMIDFVLCLIHKQAPFLKSSAVSLNSFFTDVFLLLYSIDMPASYENVRTKVVNFLQTRSLLDFSGNQNSLTTVQTFQSSSLQQNQTFTAALKRSKSSKRRD